ASCSSPSAIAFSAMPISSAPGTRTCVTSSSLTPSLASSSMQARAMRSVTSTLKRAWTTAMRSPRPSSRSASPRSALRMAGAARGQSVVGDEAGHLEAVAEQARHAARTAEQLHAADAEVAQDLRADAVRAQVERQRGLADGAAARRERVRQQRLDGLAAVEEHGGAALALLERSERARQRPRVLAEAGIEEVEHRKRLVDANEHLVARRPAAVRQRQVDAAGAVAV